MAYDEDENGEGVAGPACCLQPSVGDEFITLPPASLVSVGDNTVFPQNVMYDEQSGWIFINLSAGIGTQFAVVHRQGWIITWMRAGRLAVDIEAAALGNGCSPAVPQTDYSFDRSDGFLPGPLP